MRFQSCSSENRVLLRASDSLRANATFVIRQIMDRTGGLIFPLSKFRENRLGFMFLYKKRLLDIFKRSDFVPYRFAFLISSYFYEPKVAAYYYIALLLLSTVFPTHRRVSTRVIFDGSLHLGVKVFSR